MSRAILTGTLSREKIELEDVQDYATSDDFPGLPTDVSWMNRQGFNALAGKTRGNHFQTGKTCRRKKGVTVLGSNSCVLTRAITHAGVRDLPGESMTSSACRRAHWYLPAEMWDTALKEHVKDIGCKVADITTGIHLIFLQTIVRYSDVKKYTIDQVGLRLCYDQRLPKRDPNGVKPVETSLAEHYNHDETGETLDNDESGLHALKGKGKGKGFQG